MAILQLIFVLGLGSLVGLLFLNALTERQQRRRLDEAFYQLLETQNSEVSLIQLAALARVDAQIAQQYLERQVNLLSAILEIDDDGNTFYRFPKLRLPPSSQRDW